MPRPHLFLVLALIAALPRPATAAPDDRAAFLDLARKGWVYELRSAIWGRDPASVRMHINGHEISGAALCVVGEAPTPETAQVLQAFSALMADTFGKPLPARYAGGDLRGCGTGRVVYLRLYSGPPPIAAYNADLALLDARYGLGLPKRLQYVLSPAQAATFFGTLGQATHILVKQLPQGVAPTPLSRRFHASILTEELYQAFSFGLDILHFDRARPFVSKLQEFPMNLRAYSWDSPAFMQGLLSTNPSGLCLFDLFMLHALAEAPVENTNTPALLGFIDARFDHLAEEADATAHRADLAPILDTRCSVSD